MPTAEEAAALNLQWRAVNAPSTVTSAEQAQAQQYSNQYYNVERPAQQARDAAIQQTVIANRQMIDRQEGWNPSGAHTQEQLAAHYGNADLGRQAYSSEQDYYRANPSAAFQREISNANYQQNRIVSGNGSYRATGELKLNTTAGEGGYTGRAADYKAAFDRQVYGIGAPNNEQEYYRRQAEREVVERPGYTAPSNLGDLQTQRMRQGYGMFAQAVGSENVASDYQMTGKFLEAQRQGAYATPERRDERFFMGELQKWAEVPVEKSSAYHNIGMESGKAIPANPYEYQGDLAVEFLKGAPQKSSEFFSPVSGEMSKYLPGGLGAQQFAWNEAITDYKRQNVDARTPYPEKVSFMEGVKYLGAAEGKYGPYGKLAGGIDNGGVDLTSGRLVGSGMVGGAGVTGSDGALPAPFKSTSKQAEQPGILDQAGLWVAGAEKTVSEYTGLSKLSTPTTEQIKEMGKNPLFMSTNPAVAGLLNIPQTQEYAASFIRGEAVQLQTKPVESAINYALGYAGGVAFKGVEYGFGGLRASVATKAIAEGGGWRAAEVFAANAPKAGALLLTGAYGASVAARTTLGGTDFSPVAAERLGAITVGEALPGALGFAHGYRTPPAVYKAAELSDINYKAAIQEGTTTGRADYYVKQPATLAYERATSPITRAKLEYPQFVEEAGGSTVRGAKGYVEYKVGSAYRSNVDIPVKTFIQETPAKLKGIETAAIDPFVRARVEGVPKAQAALGKASIEFANWKYAENQPITEAVYGKYFVAKTKIPVAAEEAFLTGYRTAWELGQAAKTPSITIRSMWQERGGIDTTNLIRPAAEISRINEMSSFRYPEGVKPEGVATTKMKLESAKYTTPSRKLTGEQEPIESGKEIKSDGGSLITRVEEASPIGISKQITEQSSASIYGMPVFPGGPSPIQKQRYVVEEETQYYRLPPGMVSPGPKQETRQEMFLISSPEGRIASQMQQTPRAQVLSMDIRSVSDITQRTRESLAPVFGITPTTIIGSTVIPATRSDIIPRTATRTEIIQTPAVAIVQERIPVLDQITDTITTPAQRQIIEPITTPIIPRGGFAPIGGGGGGGHRGRRRRKVELFSFEMAEDTPIPTRFGLGGQVTEFVPGTRGLAIDILKRSDIAPNRLFEMGGDSSDHL